MIVSILIDTFWFIVKFTYSISLYITLWYPTGLSPHLSNMLVSALLWDVNTRQIIIPVFFLTFATFLFYPGFFFPRCLFQHLEYNIFADSMKYIFGDIKGQGETYLRIISWWKHTIIVFITPTFSLLVLGGLCWGLELMNLFYPWLSFDVVTLHFLRYILCCSSTSWRVLYFLAYLIIYIISTIIYWFPNHKLPVKDFFTWFKALHQITAYFSVIYAPLPVFLFGIVRRAFVSSSSWSYSLKEIATDGPTIPITWWKGWDI